MNEDIEGWYAGGCHCGAVRFRVKLHSRQALACNCSICNMKGFLNIIVQPEHFELTAGEDFLRSYRFNTRQADHRFCCVCGIHPFSRPRSHPGAFDVNARCLDAGYAWLDITPFDGQNWEANVGSIQ